MPLNIRRLPKARADRIDIWLYIATDSQSAADQTALRFDEAVELLSNYPESGSQRPHLGSGVRAFPVENYVIYYRLVPDHLEVVRILHAARDITPDMLAG